MKEERRKKERNIFLMQTGRKQNKIQNKTRQKKKNTNSLKQKKNKTQHGSIK